MANARAFPGKSFLEVFQYEFRRPNQTKVSCSAYIDAGMANIILNLRYRLVVYDFTADDDAAVVVFLSHSRR